MLNINQIKSIITNAISHNIQIDMSHNADNYSDIYFVNGNDKNDFVSLMFTDITSKLDTRINKVMSNFIDSRELKSSVFDNAIINKMDTLVDLFSKVLYESNKRFNLVIDPKLTEIWLIDNLDCKTYVSDSPLIHLDRITHLTVKVQVGIN